MAYFTEHHFELLERYQEQKYDNSNSEQTQAYQELKDAYAVTEDWARQVQRQLFPKGTVKVVKRPTSQGNKFWGYNWARIYPHRHCPDYLAYTIGINASNVFQVKIDTVHLRDNHPVRQAYLVLRGDLDNSSPIVAVLSRNEGLGKTLPELVQWTVDAIQGFSLKYDRVWAELERNRTLGNEELLQHFDNKQEFAEFRRSWTADETALFCRLVRPVHAAGLDWWHVDIDIEVRCGRKDSDSKRAVGVLAVVRGRQDRTIQFRHPVGDIAVGMSHNLEDVVDRIETSLAAGIDFRDEWQRDRPGLWPNQLQNESSQPDDDNLYGDPGLAEAERVPRNTIFYGPPGTGKTFSTAAEAVRLCGEAVSGDRGALMQSYQRLLAAGRIEFVTFHQSMSYEEFVEGRQPMTGTDEDGDTASAGFRLETVSGIFRRIAKRAETSRGRSTGGDTITVADRQVFKMSIGEANNSEDVHLFEEAVAGGYILLGFEDINWSNDKYAKREVIIKAIVEAYKKKGRPHTDVDARSGAVQMPFIFRNWVQPGDFVVVSKGNSLFRAIGEFTGDYEFHPRQEGGYAHRRPVRWHWVDREGVSVSEIYTRRFSQKTIYQLFGSELNVPALERYLNSQQTDGPVEPESFVLIIDEINRANISKVFGELITLLEPDKRLGQPNELKVRLPYSGDDFGVPSNLHILGTMNTADRSIALLDTALRRRFTFHEMMPNPSLLRRAAETSGLDLPQILATINERIEYLYDREHQIGHAYFIDCTSRSDVDAVMRHKVIPLLAEYFFEDAEKIATVLGDATSDGEPIEGGFLNRSMLVAPPGLEEGDAPPRYRWEVRSQDDGFDYTKLSGA